MNYKALIAAIARLRLVLALCGFAVFAHSATAQTIQIQTVGSSFNAEFAFDNRPPSTYQWTWSDSTTSTNYPVVSKSFGSSGVRNQFLDFLPTSALTKINMGFDGSDGGWTNSFSMRSNQNVGLALFAVPLTGLQLWASSYSPISNTMDFHGFMSLQDIECFHCSSLQHVVVTNLPSLQRVCFEACNLQELDIRGDTNLADVRGALNSYTGVTIGDGTGPKIWHWCFRDNPQIRQDFSTIMTNFFSLQEAWFWNANQGGALHFVSTNLTDVEVFQNQYTSADFTGEQNMFELLINDNILTNLTITGCSNLVQFDAHNNQLPTAVLDAILTELDMHIPGVQTVDLSGNPQFPSVIGYAHYSNLTNRGVSVNLDFPVQTVSWPVMTLNSAVLTSESLLPTNNAIDPGETVTVQFSLSNVGPGDATNLTVRLLATNGVISPSAAQVYSNIVTGGAAITPSFTFIASGSCGGAITPTLQIEENGGILAKIPVPFQLGQPVTVFSENFDGVTAPALPPGWTQTNSGAQAPWVTDNTLSDTPPNSVFTGDAPALGISILTSPAINLPSNICLLTFQNAYDLECDNVSPTNGFDGGVLEIQVGTNAFQDIVTAGGSFVSGGYNRTISTNYQNALAGRQAWSGHSGGFVTTIVNLPATALGNTIYLRWNCATDIGNGAGNWTGWRIDSVSITGGSCSADESPPMIQSVVTSNGVATVTWNSIVGRNYRLQYTTSINGTSWTDLMPDITATNSTASTTDSIAGFSQKFYRVILLP